MLISNDILMSLVQELFSITLTLISKLSLVTQEFIENLDSVIVNGVNPFLYFKFLCKLIINQRLLK